MAGIRQGSAFSQQVWFAIVDDRKSACAPSSAGSIVSIVPHAVACQPCQALAREHSRHCQAAGWTAPGKGTHSTATRLQLPSPGGSQRSTWPGVHAAHSLILHGLITSPPIDNLHTVLQAQHLRDLNARGDAEGVIRLFENGRVQSTEASLGEYVKALVKADRLDNTMLARTLQVGCGLSACFEQAPRLGSDIPL